MSDPFDVCVVIPTYNRCEMLPEALESVLAQNAEGVRYEVIVVDNNSTDQTRKVIETFVARDETRVRYVFERAQGIAHGRNAGIANTTARVIAFTDDDVRVAKNWAAGIKRTFDDHPEVDYIGGKVLPRWRSEPPRWLTREHWSPLALLDHGDRPFYSNSRKTTCLIGANFAFRREVFEKYGLFTPECSPSEDHEFQLRLWRDGRQGLYAPDLVVTADVQPERMEKPYHRMWYARHGARNAVMRGKITDDSSRLMIERPDVVTFFGAPAFVYRRLLTDGARLLTAALSGQESRAFLQENQVRRWIGYIKKRYEMNAAERGHSPLTEIGTFAKAMLRKKVMSKSS